MREIVDYFFIVIVFFGGLLSGIITHYLFHRMILSSEPFLYVIF